MCRNIKVLANLDPPATEEEAQRTRERARKRFGQGETAPASG